MGDIHFPVLFIAGSIFILLFAVGFIGMKIRIPGVVLYILLGIGLGGYFSGSHPLHLAGEVGIVLLFFMLGMEFPVRRLAGIAKSGPGRYPGCVSQSVRHHGHLPVFRPGLDHILSHGRWSGICHLLVHHRQNSGEFKTHGQSGV